jgi:hypothetical protein
MKGTIKRIEPIVEVSDKFKKRELHLSVMDGQYEQIINIEFHQDNCAKLDNFGAGQEVEVDFNIRGREWQKDDKSPIRVFNTLAGWKIEAVGTLERLRVKTKTICLTF